MDGRAPAEPGWTDALRGVVDKEIDRDCEALDLYGNGLGAAGAAALAPALQHAQCRLTKLGLQGNGLRAAAGRERRRWCRRCSTRSAASRS